MAATPTKKPYLVRNSGIHGRGVFATETIRRGTVIVEYKGQRASWDEAMTRPDSDPDDTAHTFLFQLDDGRVIDARPSAETRRAGSIIPAIPIPQTSEDEDGRVFIESRRKIQPGEELFLDFDLHIDGRLSKRERAQYACRCGAGKCRGSLLDKGR